MEAIQKIIIRNFDELNISHDEELQSKNGIHLLCIFLQWQKAWIILFEVSQMQIDIITILSYFTSIIT